MQSGRQPPAVHDGAAHTPSGDPGASGGGIAGTLLEVALPLPLPRTFTYRFDGGPLAEGTRVLVPFAHRRLVGWVAGPGAEDAPADGIRNVIRALDEAPAVPAELLRLCRWVADYYVAPLGQVLRAALPAVLSDNARPDPAVKVRNVLRLTRDLPSLEERNALFARAPRQRECYELLEAMGGQAEVAYLTGQCGYASAVLRGLVDKGLAELAPEEAERDPFADVVPDEPPSLRPTQAQANVLERLFAASRAGQGSGPDPAPSTGGPALAERMAAQAAARLAPKPFLLRGVTGSGKTLVYIELLKEVVQRQGRGAIVLVPEIALTPQTVARFRSHFGDDVAVLHSGLSDGERYDAWRALHRGERRIAVGARSAVFAPVRSLGAIIVDEEHETSYKQSDAPRYHAREVAIVRAAMAGAVCLLGSATPALESWHNARIGKFELLELPERVAGRPLPPVQVIDLRAERQKARESDSLDGPSGSTAAADGVGAVDSLAPGKLDRARVGRADEMVLSPPLVEAMHRRLARGEQIVLLLNRRGYATFVQCRACGNVWHCPQCNVSLTYHRARRRLVCHHCFHHEPAPQRCDACGAGELSFRGVGTEQVERAVGDTFPHARIARMDVDTTSGKWAHHRILERVEQGEVDILLGTQMIAKGLDFPRVTLVGVINADVGLNLPDFRASERTFQLLTQVAGRAGRGPAGGEVLIQTSLPNHYVIQAASSHDYAGFAERELSERAAPSYPPFTRLANIVISGTEEVAVQEAAVAAAHWLADRLRRGRDQEISLTGPAPCPIDRVRGRWRWHFLLRSPSARALGNACHLLFAEHPLRPGRAELRMAIDRDPVGLL